MRSLLAPIARLLLPSDFRLYLRTRRMGGHFRLRTPDRIFLEDEVVPWLRDQAGVKAVLDVGCDWYTRAYPDLTGAERYETIDLDPAKARHARSSKHHVGSVLELDRHVEADAFDLIMCNGVLGWGVNERNQIAEAAGQLARALKPGGWLVLGWNDVDPWRPACLKAFEIAPLKRVLFPPAGSDTHLTETKSRHTYRFFKHSMVASDRN
ncbi:class I SAM-dependent methyltransferase [Luteolibacter sp. GHJ8]|uniref:Class I SAM-dependent methyltransferase n=1 Tax=Luteolibacter rhizosphaerae TaxID=2989719 RepID=A0ABT3G9V4_9BACT|nr:class I SAM-dependent methyltransferase [Luteolibacter rhizosphaerae]MCW1916628.1 class I SAM-dependent methyltransferase [Luteolibacter rhizosphaerae]